MSFWIDDLPAFFGDLAVEATLEDGTKLRGMFDTEFVGVGEPAIETFGPQFECRSSDVANLAYGAELTIDEVDYVVRSIQPNGTGTTILKLEKV